MKPGAWLACAAWALSGQAAGQDRCKADLVTGPGGEVVLNGVAWEPAGARRPAHCSITGTIGAHLGPPAQTAYGNNFRLRIPEPWNGRFLFQGGGGNNGVVGDALGILKDGQLALAQGYAVAAQDSGHTGRDPSFALDRRAYLDFAHQGAHQVTLASKSILMQYAGRAPAFSYFVGCSNGGREALVSAQRYDDFDGVVAGNPGNAIYDQWVHNLSVLRMVSRVAGVAQGVAPSDTSGAFTDAQLVRVAQHFMGKCDGQDGLVDGIMSNYQACKAEPTDFVALQCRGEAHCLSPLQSAGLKQLYEGLSDASGSLVHPGFFPGSVEAGMRDIYLGSPGSDFPLGSFYKSIMANFYFMGYGFQAYSGLTGPPDKLSSYPTSSVPYVAGFDFATEPAKLHAGRSDFHGVDFDAFHKRGGKMLIYTGSADPAVQAGGIIALIDRIKARYQGASDMARLFVVPGMEHCRGGATADQFDQLAPLAAWVERGLAPERIAASALPGSKLDPARHGLTRPLCAYPNHARYVSGPANLAGSFTCSPQQGPK